MQTSFTIQTRSLNTKQKLQVDLQDISFFFNLQSCFFFLYEDCNFPLKQGMCLEAEVVNYFWLCLEKNYHFVVLWHNNNKRGALNK